MSADPGRHGGDYEVLGALLDWFHAGERGALVTVLRTWGSSPRPPGSLLAIRRSDGDMVGSVSGGCVEADLAERYLCGEIAAIPTLIDYGAEAGEANRLGLPCGGRLELLLEEPSADTLLPVVERMVDGETCERRVNLASGVATLHECGDMIDLEVDPVRGLVRKQFGPRWRLLIVGAGQLADCLGRIAQTLGFRVTICDPRTELDSRLSDVTVSRRMPDELVAEWRESTRSAVVTLAHDPKLDDLALIEALPGDFFYVGALGSQRTAAARRARLETLGVGARDVARLRAPAGIDIGSRTPPEIAVSIAAELTAARYGLSFPT